MYVMLCYVCVNCRNRGRTEWRDAEIREAVCVCREMAIAIAIALQFRLFPSFILSWRCRSGRRGVEDGAQLWARGCGVLRSPLRRLQPHPHLPCLRRGLPWLSLLRRPWIALRFPLPNPNRLSLRNTHSLFYSLSCLAQYQFAEDWIPLICICMDVPSNEFFDGCYA